VRLALVSNIDAVKRLDSNVLREMIGEDVDLYTESLVSLTNLTCLTIFNQLAHSGTETLRQKTKTEEYIAEGLKHPDIEVRETAYRMKLRLANSIENPGTVEKHLGRQNLQTEVLPIDLYGQADDYFYYLGISQETPGVKTLLLPLPASLHYMIADLLPEGDETIAMIERLASHPSTLVRSRIAERKDLSPRAIKTLKADTCYAVRQALLQNRDVVDQLSHEEILAMLADDSMLFLNAFKYGDINRRLQRIFFETFSQSQDPCLLEALAEMED
jgi:hypothetical protein